MNITYLISPTAIKCLTNISDNLSEKYITTAIRETQQVDLNQVLGDNLLVSIENMVTDGSIQDDDNRAYKTLLDNYISYFLAYGTVVKLIPIVAVKIDNAGAVQNGDEKAENISLKDMFELSGFYMQKADYYKARLQKYLREHYKDYPQLDCSSEIHSAYSSPFYLGGMRHKRVPRGHSHSSGTSAPLKKHTISYYVDNVLFTSKTYVQGAPIKYVDAPVKEGYNFNVWIYEKNGVWENLPDFMPDYDIVTYAHYIPVGGEQHYYTIRYRVADWCEDSQIGFDNMAYIPEPFEWLQCVEREYDPNTREGWAKLTHPSLRFDSEIKIQKFTGYDCLFMLDLSDFNNTILTDRLFFDCQTIREFYPPKGLIGIEGGYTFYNCQYLTTINFATAEGYRAYEPFAYPLTGVFCHCVSLTEILADNQPHIHSDNGNLYNYLDELMAARYSDVTLKDGCTAILSESLKARGLTTLTIPSSVRTIEVYAISENPGLSDVYFGGTMQQWADIYKPDVNTIFVDTNVTVIHCSDGDCPIDYAGEEQAEYKIDIFIEWDFHETRWFKVGERIELPEPPVREGYVFNSWNALREDGWFECPEFMVPYNFEVHASYGEEPAEHKIDIFIEWDYLETRWFKVGERIELPEPPHRDGYVFLEWGAIVPGGDWFTLPEFMPDYNFEVHASYAEEQPAEKQVYTLTYFNSRGGGVKTDEILKQITLNEGDVIDYFEPEVREGFTHTHWVYHRDIDESVIGNAETEMATMPAHDLEVWAYYEFNSYDVYYTLYDENGEIYFEDYVTYRYTDTINPYHPDVPEGYVFNGWEYEPATMPAHDVVVTGRLVKTDNPSDYSSQYTTFEALEDGTFSFTKRGTGDDIQYSKDNGATWNYLASGENVSVATGDKVMWKSTIAPSASYGIGKFVATNRFNAYGNAMSLLYGDNFNGQTSLYGKKFALKECLTKTNVVDASNLVLPATTLATYSYEGMFSGCSSLTTAPELPATTLVDSCYGAMFSGCTSLTTAPELPATTLAESCYYNMFGYCTNLTTAPELPATTLADYCYREMFCDCESLTTAPELPATTLAKQCYYEMFSDCKGFNEVTILATDISAENCLNNWLLRAASTGTIKCVSGVNYPQGTSGIPSGWTVEYL